MSSTDGGLSRHDLARYVDHTLLKPDATTADVGALISEAVQLGVFAICVSPSMLPLTTELPSDLTLATVAGFPSGKHTTAIKVAEAAGAVQAGADEVDMVIDRGLLRSDPSALAQQIAAVKAQVPGILKVIIESAALTDDEIVTACRCCVDAGADYVKTSTGFDPAGGASVHAVALMAQTVAGRLGVKASGGIRDYACAAAMIEAGATRLGLSGTRAVLDGCPS